MDGIRSTSTRRRSSSDSNSPEFEFWMVRNPSFPQPNLLSADELFVDGVLLPLHLLSHRQSDPPDPNPTTDPEPPSMEPGAQEQEAESGPELRQVTAESSTNGLTSSKRWKDIFKKGQKKTTTKNAEEKEKKRDKKSQTAASSAELNINIWPFSRSRSAGNSATRPRMVPGAPGTRKVSSAPCSRSNSAGESKSRKWSSSPGRAGVHVGRSSPIWQVKRGGSGVTKTFEAAVRSGEKVGGKKENRSKLVGNNGGKARVLNLNVNVPMCIGYRHHLSCRSDENSALGVVGVGNNKNSGNGGSVAAVATAAGGGGGGNNSVAVISTSALKRSSCGNVHEGSGGISQ
ncbi:putative Serine/arginine repetitive matrix protein 2 [Melia azedarach]|uniref:Serine/arginine repetitive matrix protein 2 n=1 Tax=Melia azedarach TaxID=155640 RepID=A0ACC1WXM2_MELAZ|nr:putative Serine/arginine repetitive matrix protein 2 [Melia azedarach]